MGSELERGLSERNITKGTLSICVTYNFMKQKTIQTNRDFSRNGSLCPGLAWWFPTNRDPGYSVSVSVSLCSKWLQKHRSVIKSIRKEEEKKSCGLLLFKIARKSPQYFLLYVIDQNLHM